MMGNPSFSPDLNRRVRGDSGEKEFIPSAFSGVLAVFGLWGFKGAEPLCNEGYTRRVH